jgi:hypothetical protein
MTNMLPKDALGNARAFYRSRFVFVASLILIVCALLAFVVLLPAYSIVRDGEDDAPSTPESSSALGDDADRVEIDRARELVKEFRAFATSTAPTLSLLEEVLTVRPSGITIDRIDMIRGEGGSIVLSGRAATRDLLNKYRTVLTENSRFKNVTIPLGALAGGADDRFTLTLSGSI